MTVAIEVKNLEKQYRRGGETVHALRGASFTIEQGCFTAVTGPSGSGKTTLLHCAGCLDKPTAGSVIIGGTDVSSMDEASIIALRRERIGFVFQQFYLLDGLTVEENMALPLLFARRKPDAGVVERLLETTGLTTRRRHYPRELSGGEMQRVAIGRALVNKPSIVFADEPTANLDSVNAGKVLDLFGRLRDDGVTIVLVTHNPDIARRADREIRLEDGVVVRS